MSDVPAIRVRPFATVLLGLLAAIGGVAAGWQMWRADRVAGAALALALHVMAGLGARGAARAAGGGDAEGDLVWVLATALPGCGPALAWLVPFGRGRGAVQNAHAAFEAGEVRRTDVIRAPLLERELGVRSHAQVLRHGSLEEKRNLLRRIARLGSPRYFAELRQFLRDSEPELRLCAYAELARLGQEREAQIGSLRTAVEAAVAAGPLAQAVALARLAEANRGYAQSGLLDVDMADYWLRQAIAIAEQAVALAPDELAVQCAVAAAIADAGEIDRAWALARSWPADAASALVLVRAEIAFRRRDRATCRGAAAMLQARGEVLPNWLAAVIGDSRDGGGRVGAAASAPGRDRFGDRPESSLWMARETEVAGQQETKA